MLYLPSLLRSYGYRTLGSLLLRRRESYLKADNEMEEVEVGAEMDEHGLGFS